MSDGQDAEVLRGAGPRGAGRAAARARAARRPRRAAAPARRPPQDGPALTPRDGVRDVETVSLRTDAELAAFVTRLLHLFENPRHRR